MTGPSIARRKPFDVEDGFEQLREEGLRLVRRMSRERWTDYNLHDPGVTLLEQLCYGLTDLAYRVGFPIEDHLTGPSGEIDYARQALHLPAEILPCRPTTAPDLRREILDAVPHLEDVGVWPWGAPELGGSGLQGAPGLLVIMVRAVEAPGRGEDPRAAALRVARRSRNLGEDVHPMVVTPDVVRIELEAEVQVEGGRPPSEILGDVYRTAAEYVAGRPTPYAGARALRDGRTLDQVFDGPAGVHGPTLLAEDGFDERHIFTADLAARVSAVEGVRRVDRLRLVPVDPPPGTRLDADRIARVKVDRGDRGATWWVPRLVEPEAGWTSRVVLRRGEQVLPYPVELPARYAAERVTERLRHRDEAMGAFYEPPRGTRRELGRYRSIQHHLPSIYGVGAEGLPASATVAHRREVARLKGYLLLLEQLMADYCAQLDAVRDLFASGAEGGTYRCRPLGADEVPGFATVYGDAGPGPYLSDPSPFLADATASYDHASERRGRLLDHLLAIFGEGREQATTWPDSVAGDDPALPGTEELPEEPGAEASGPRPSRRDEEYLEAVVEVTRDRVGAFDYGEPLWWNEDARPAERRVERGPRESVSGFRRRVALSLGLRDVTAGPLTGAVDDEGFHVLEHVLLRPVHGRRELRFEGAVAGLPDADTLWSRFYPLRVSIVFPAWAGRFRDDGFRRHAEAVVAEACPAHVLPHCHWLDREEMEAFEGAYHPWLVRRRAWCLEWPGGAGMELDRASAVLISLLAERCGAGAGVAHA